MPMVDIQKENWLNIFAATLIAKNFVWKTVNEFGKLRYTKMSKSSENIPGPVPVSIFGPSLKTVIQTNGISHPSYRLNSNCWHFIGAINYRSPEPRSSCLKLVDPFKILSRKNRVWRGYTLVLQTISVVCLKFFVISCLLLSIP